MCTTITVKSEEGSVAGRTMEFAIDLGFQPVFVPRGIVYRKDEKNENLVSKNAFIGTAVENEGDYSFFDGVNEKGIIGCANYFAGDADYPEKVSGNKKYSLRADVFPSFILANCNTIEDIRKIIKDVELLDMEDAENQPTSLTLHFAFYDKEGQAIVVEPLEKTLKVIDNPVGVMTNSPSFEWHLTNLRNYVHITPENKNTNKFSSLNVRRFGEGSGLLGLPGDSTPPSRFVRAAHYVSNMPVQKTANEAVEEAFHILSNFDIPEGAIYNPDVDGCDTTHYTAVMDSKNLTYNVASKKNRAIHQISLLHLDVNSKEMKVYDMPKEQTIVALG